MKKLKSSEEYLKGVNAFTLREELYSIGKQIQLDTIQTTVENCASIIEDSTDGTYNQIMAVVEEMKKLNKIE